VGLEIVGIVIVAFFVVAVLVYYFLRFRKTESHPEVLTPEDRAEMAQAALDAQEAQAQKALLWQVAQHESQHGPINPAMICPHCQTKGAVRTRAVTQKKGVSGGKATAAVLTGGISMLGTGLSRKENLTEAHCDNCGSTWHF